MKYNLKNKRGELTDIMIFLITVFILAIGLFVLLFVAPSLSTGLRAGGLNNTAAGESAISQSLDQFNGIINNGFMFIVVGLIISMMITSFLVRTHPIFLFLYIIFLAITLILGAYLGNAYDQMITNPVFATILSDATFFTLVMGHIVEITLATGALSMIIVFAKFSSIGGDGQQF